MKLNLGYIVIGLFVVILAIRWFTKSVYEGLDNASLITAAESRQKDYLKNQDKYWDNRKFPQTAPGLSGDVKFKKLDASNQNLRESHAADVMTTWRQFNVPGFCSANKRSNFCSVFCS